MYASVLARQSSIDTFWKLPEWSHSSDLGRLTLMGYLRLVLNPANPSPFQWEMKWIYMGLIIKLKWQSYRFLIDDVGTNPCGIFIMDRFTARWPSLLESPGLFIRRGRCHRSSQNSPSGLQVKPHSERWPIPYVSWILDVELYWYI